MSGPPVIGLDVRKARDFGIGTYTRELVAAIAEAPAAEDFRFVLFVRPDDREIFSCLPENFSLETADFPGYSLSELTSFARQIRRRELSLFHALHYVLPPRLGVRAVVTVHDLIHLHPGLSGKPWAYPYARLALSSALRRASEVLTGSEATRSEIVARFPFAAGRIEVVPHGVSSRFRPGDGRGQAPELEKYGLPPRFALFFGGDRPHKNLVRVLEAFSLANAPDLALVLAGPPPRRAAAKRLLSSPDLARRVRILGVVPEEDLPALHSSALFLLAPTLQEGFGLPALEAMASGTPVVASAIPVWRETCGDAALLADPSDPRSIAEAVRWLAESAGERARLRELGLRRAAAFPWKGAAEKTLAVYRKALSAKP